MRQEWFDYNTLKKGLPPLSETAAYIKTLPLHNTQEIVTDNSQELRIKLKIKPTHDFIMEILSHGDKVKVIEPEGLREEVMGVLERAFRRYHD